MNHEQNHPEGVFPQLPLYSSFMERGVKALTGFKTYYEQLRQLIIWLGLTELAWVAFWLLHADDMESGYVWTVGFWIVAMLTWMGLVIFLGTRGFFLEHTRWLSNLVGVFLVVGFAAVLFGMVPFGREGLIRAAKGTTDLQLVSIHVLRLLAIGTVIKYMEGQLPRHFIIWGSLPDFLFGVSAVVVTSLATYGSLSQDFLYTWHAVGFSLFAGAGISMFFSVPSPLRLYHDKPDTSIVFQFPMVLAPNFTVPLFMLAHAFALLKLYTS